MPTLCVVRTTECWGVGETSSAVRPANAVRQNREVKVHVMTRSQPGHVPSTHPQAQAYSQEEAPILRRVWWLGTWEGPSYKGAKGWPGWQSADRETCSFPRDAARASTAFRSAHSGGQF